MAVIARSDRPRGRGLVTLILLLALLGLLWWQRLAIVDQIRLFNYQPPATIAQLATDDTMTGYARHMYYVNRPELKDRSTFSDSCSTGTEQTVVLGCYKGGQGGIYLLKVTNAELAGIQQVTAAHEMLHAAYDRLSGGERQRVDGLLEDYYQHQLNDDTIKQTIEDYKKTEPNDLVNEMHSIFGTEIADLPPALSAYYARYFMQRSAVTDYYARYDQAFTSRQQQVKRYDAQLNNLKSSIDQLKTTVTRQQSDLQARRATLDRYRTSGNTSAYNSNVDSYNAAVTAYNNNVARLQSDIAQYNRLVETRNSIALEERQLVQSISAAKVTP